jgi:hypothetical protein
MRGDDYGTKQVLEYEATGSDAVRRGVKKSLQKAGIPARPHIVDVAAKHATMHGHLTARDIRFMSEKPWTAKELQQYGAYAMWGKGRQMNDMNQTTYDTLAKYFPNGRFYIGWDEIYVFVNKDASTPMGRTYMEQRDIYWELIGPRANSDEYGVEGPMGDQLCFHFWWD